MKQLYLCSNCSAPVAYGYRFCSNCGSKLDWAIPQIPPNPSSLSGGCQHPHQQPAWRQQPMQNECQKQHKYANRDVVPQNRSQATGSTIAPMRSEIFKLLDELLDKPNKYN